MLKFQKLSTKVGASYFLNVIVKCYWALMVELRFQYFCFIFLVFYSKIGSFTIFLLVVYDTTLENCTKFFLEKTDLLVMTKHPTKNDCCLKCQLVVSTCGSENSGDTWSEKVWSGSGFFREEEVILGWRR